MSQTVSRWDKHFIDICIECSRMSKDPSTKVGSVIVSPDREIISTGFNGLPRGVMDTEERLFNRELKYKLIVHAEMNAILAAAKLGHPLKGTTLYVAATGVAGVWGGPPCLRCAVEIIQAGISKIVSIPFKNVPSKWQESLKEAQKILSEAGIEYTEIPWQR